MLSVRLPDFSLTDTRFSKVLWASVTALDSPQKYHLTLLATCFLPAVLLPSFSNREGVHLQLRDFKALLLKCIHQLSSRWFKTSTKHMHEFSFTPTAFPSAKAFLFLCFCMKFPGCRCPLNIGSSAVFTTEAPTLRALPAIHSPSCSEHFLPALSGKLRLLKRGGCQHLCFLLLVQHLCPHGSSSVTAGPNRVDGCMLMDPHPSCAWQLCMSDVHIPKTQVCSQFIFPHVL